MSAKPSIFILGKSTLERKEKKPDQKFNVSLLQLNLGSIPTRFRKKQTYF